MTKQELITQLAASLKISKKQSADMLAALSELIVKTLQSGEEISLTGLGKFVVKNRKARKGINPKTLEKINIPARNVPAFRPAKGLKEAIR